MKTLFGISNVLTAFGLLSLAIFGFTKTSVNWPSFFAKNMEYISYGCIGLGYLLTIIYYFKTKNSKRARQLLIFAAVATALITLAIYGTK